MRTSGASRCSWSRALLAASAVLLALGTTSIGLAQDVPSENTGPRFSEVGPGRQMPAAQNPQPEIAPRGELGAPAPGAAPPPSIPAPAPNRWSGCNYNLTGSWQLNGFETTPTAYPYSGTLQVNQYGQWLQISQDGGVLNYYGQCTGNSIQLDAYQGSQFIGYQNGSVSWNGRFGGLRAQFDWATWAPNYQSGNETWQRQGFFVQ